MATVTVLDTFSGSCCEKRKNYNATSVPACFRGLSNHRRAVLHCMDC